ncbi:hypothetical protein LEMLEM_LOCUS10247 [Lemmus lemmus]
MQPTLVLFCFLKDMRDSHSTPCLWTTPRDLASALLS